MMSGIKIGSTVYNKNGTRATVMSVNGDSIGIMTKTGIRLVKASSLVTNPRLASKIIDGRVVVDLDMLDLNYRPTVATPSWKPTAEIKPYEQLTKTFLDIETDGLDPDEGRIYMVGMMNELGDRIIIDCDDEIQLLKKTINILTKKKPDVLVGHNIFHFDLPFLMRRCQKYGISTPFKYGNHQTKITSAVMNGRFIEFLAIYWNGVDIIDTQHQLAIWDKSEAKLTGYKLKDGVLALKLRDSRRLEIDTTKIGKMIADGESEIVKEYLNYDLDDTSLLFEFLFPIIYAQLNYVPDLNIQQLAIASPAKKAQKIHEQLLGKSATTDERVKYTGGKVSLLKPGLHASVAKIDVSSLYPAIMLRYGLCSRKDTENRFLGVLECMKVERMRLKELAETGDKAAYFEQKALKILINGSYGFFGTGFYTWNDYHAAALITAYGRKILDLMVEVVEREDGTTIEIDTDGIFFSSDNPQHVYRAVTEALPDGIEIALEVSNYGMYVPKAKNYVLVSPEGKVSSTGIFIKRNRYQLEKDFPIQFIKLYFTEGASVAEDYYQEVRSSLIDGTIPVEHLTVTRKIAKNEKALVELGIGQCGERVSFWFTEHKRYKNPTAKQKKAKPEYKGDPLVSKPIQTNTDDYWSDYYVNRLDETYKLIKSTDNITDEQRIKLGIKVEPIDPESDEEIIIE
jgi:DNA polymerase, archaea type